ncbi:substance-K receptor-like [Homarus americanus]|uniref:substance-K receptor-like n=1 Tax=Homarus americanus TaxID=6706 RepID=UPI001C46C2D2|nr:substance-K receptor-like [Homarus americanus]
MADRKHHNLTIEDVTYLLSQVSKIVCNDSCCRYKDNDVICFSDYNYTDKHNLTYTPTWEMTVRWTYVTLVVLVALLGNLCTIIILLKNRLLLRTSVNHFILNMSVADLILTITGPIPFTIRDTSYFWPLGKVWCHLEGYIQMLVLLVSVTSLATISFDRMLGVVRPFHNHLKLWQSVAIIILIWISSAIIAVPWCIYRVYTKHIWKDMTQTICGESDKIHTWWIVGVIGLTWLPLSVMVVCYTTIIICFHHRKFKVASSKEHPVMTHLKKRVVKMIFMVVIIFAICWTPMQLLKITNNEFLDDNGQFKDEATERTYNILLTVAQYMVYINPAVNPIVYALMHQTFRRAFRVTFPCFYKNESSLVLTPGHGMRRYLWSYRSTTTSNACGNDISKLPRRWTRSEQGGTPGAVLSSSAVAASIALDSEAKRYKREWSTEGPEPSVSRRTKFRCRSRSVGSDGPSDSKCKIPKGRHSSDDTASPLGTRSKKRSRSLGSEKSFDTMIKIEKERKSSEGFERGDGSERATMAHLSYPNEGFVRDLQPRRMSFVSTGTLGYLITQVIEEETASDVENERVL